ncbi:PAS-domain containing protein [Plastoroseomonas arctica]|uniref:Sensory/regulatory protein RpfC n=1 Tax=Plastoroseomonas arctica TaxID=1509237 RepID=A0AAF1K0Y9_9PROT|nr:PAS-domain containing protein [Plastoroseomonas arctica]MBR0657023.1 response regulator [Plastoroseomonas arctica]
MSHPAAILDPSDRAFSPVLAAALLPALLDGLVAGVAVYDEQLRRVLSNPSLDRMFSLEPALTAPGTPLRDQVDAMRQAGFLDDAAAASILEAFAADDRRTCQWQSADGRTFEMVVMPAPGIGRLAICRDATKARQTERQLADEREVLATIIENLPDGVMLFDSEFRWRTSNRRLMEFGRFSPEIAHPGASGADIVRFQAMRGDFGPVPDDPVALEALVSERVGYMRKPGGNRYVRLTAGGFWIEFNMIPLPDGGLLAFYRDISELKRREAELESERGLLREVLESMDAMVVLFDADGDVVLSNDRYRDLLGMPDHLFTANSSLEAGLRWLYRRGDFGFARDEDTTVGDRVATIYGGQPLRYSRRMPHGAWVEFTYRPISGGRVIGHARDISPLKAREEDAVRAQARAEAAGTTLRSVLDTLGDGVALVEYNGDWIIHNRAMWEMNGLPRALFDDHANIRDGYHRHMLESGEVPRVCPTIEGDLDLYMERLQQADDAPYQRQRTNGRWIEHRTVRLPADRRLLIQRDITELKRTEAALREERDAAEAAGRAKASFLASMSHEIRTPMNGVLGMLEVLSRSDLRPDQARSVTVMRESAHSLLRIIDDVLDFSKIEAGRLEFEAVPFSLRGIIEGTVETLTPEASRRNLALFATIPDGAANIFEGDPTRVRQILFNLVGNALKFTERGFVRITAEIREEGPTALVAIAVEDSGVGMDAETIERLFQPFTQADSSTTRRFGGTGLGLSIVRRLAELMQGEVTLQSTPGRGSCFTVTLRLKPVQASLLAAPGREAELMSETASGPGHLLVVDDHPTNLEVITAQLELLGVQAMAASDGQKALALWRKERFDTVLLDIHMPVMDGFELARSIRAEEQRLSLPRTTLIAVTANALKGEAERCYAAGMDGFLAKPVSIEGLSRVLRRFHPDAVKGAEGGGALFDPDALRGLFGQQRERLRGILDGFAQQAANDIASLPELTPARQAEIAHRLKGSARMIGARLLAEAAQALEEAARSGNPEATAAIAAKLPRLLQDTLAAARPALGI